jgi:hypothetical protein
MTGLQEEGAGFPTYLYKPPKNLLRLTTKELPFKAEVLLLRL